MPRWESVDIYFVQKSGLPEVVWIKVHVRWTQSQWKMEDYGAKASVWYDMGMHQ